MDVIVADEGELLLGLCAEQLVKQTSRAAPVPERLHHVLQQLLHVQAQVQQHVTRLTLTITGQQLQRLTGRLLTLQALGFGSRSLREKRMRSCKVEDHRHERVRKRKLEMHRSTGQGPELADFHMISSDRWVSLPIPSRSVLTSHLRRLIIYLCRARRGLCSKSECVRDSCRNQYK